MKKIDELEIEELVETFNNSTYDVIKALEVSKKQQKAIIEQAIKSISQGGSVYYIGAGTSGRIGLLDALDIATTFGESNWFKYQISGGDKSVLTNNEETEDDTSLAIKELEKLNLMPNDFIIGMSASGTTKYVYEAILFAKDKGCKTALICSICNSNISKIVDFELALKTGTELIEGSSRLKAATALKIALNNISTISAIKLGKVYNGLMVGLKPNNIKTYTRCLNMISTIANCDIDEAEKFFKASEENVSLAIIMKVKNVSLDMAKKLFVTSNSQQGSYGNLRKIIG
ncbi:N-acetylmuramic acid 6-phosphate etherase [Mycoplasma crocodyli]|uniref:SIS domain-containing protein n=1 Tax=Mycoplasma crocodyli (strain ATCC 51981 / MP145) TaxID=512564 RepID=D5E595_MYCCM|nr:N-acetylmuramic acid 6-phosphate etherase [Mycoplasma crocodyli]ADE19638.1 hypothetical protein MCRO_0286 [Mycoplasma crocodyli MP145]